jgi:outer membrane cobalamin receptor
MKKLLLKRLLIALLVVIQAGAARAADDTFQLFEEEANIVIATQRLQRPEEAPSIVSVVSRQEIERYGARDLADILRLVPGFEFGLDVIGLVGSSFRGIWAHEGKSLLMINGVMQNELGFGNYNFFGSIPASVIERVEIIRGPGSAIYGGFAVVNVINVITHQPKNLNGARVSAEAGALSRGGSSRAANISYGSETDALRVAVHTGYGSDILSQRDYTDFGGTRLKLNRDTAYRNWRHIITEATAKDLTLRYQRTSFGFSGKDGFTTIQPPADGANLERVNNYNDVVHLDYKAEVMDRWTIRPLFEYTRNNTWNFELPTSLDGNLQGPGTTLWRYRAELSAAYKTQESTELMFGGGYIEDGVESVSSDGTPGLLVSANPATRTQKSSQFGLIQYIQKINRFGLTLGGRYEDSSFGSAFAPRAGLTFVQDDFNAKLLYGRAFRIPLPWQVHSRQFGASAGLKPETADTAEMELGYKFTSRISGKINVFFIDIKEPIVYKGNTNTYVNFGKIQSQGLEAQLRTDYSRAGGFTNVSYAVPGRGTSPGFTTQSKKQFLASPPVKVDVGAYYRTKMFELSPSATYLSHRAGQSRDSANSPNGVLATTDYSALLLANMNVIARNVIKNLDVHLAVHNIFDSRYVVIQPYYGAHSPLPASDREINLGATWRF